MNSYVMIPPQQVGSSSVSIIFFLTVGFGMLNIKGSVCALLHSTVLLPHFLKKITTFEVTP